MPLTSGTRIGPYEVVGALGAGGMGEVYRAHDAILGRDVALKVLRPDATADPARFERFTREARAIAALNHPNIVTIFSTEESEGVRFLTMELVEGASLDAIIPPRGLPAERLVEVALQLADALAAAHEKGITHRDLKPGNVMLDRSGRVKILDFGLAKVITATEGGLAHTQLNLSREGVVVGTIPYMSPEQIEGKPVDHRTDIFSFGVLLHELATGERPFQGGSPAALMSAILRDPPPPVTIRRPDLSESVDHVIRRCLEKDPRDRYQAAGDIRHEIQRSAQAIEARWAATLEPPKPPKDGALSLGVMPFKAQAGEPVAAALASGLTEDIGTGFARFSYVNVVNRTADVTHGARYVLDGRVRTAGPTVRVSTQLVDTTSGASLWAETYTRDITPARTFDVQDDVSGRIVATVADSYGVLTRAMSVVARSKEVTSPYEAVLRGLGYWQLGTPEEHAHVREGLEKAVEHTPEYADAWGSLALMYIEEHKHGFNARPDPFGRAQAAIRRALALDAANQFAYHALAQASFFQHDLSAFGPAAERAIALNPLDGGTVAYMGILIAYSGDWERGVEIADRAINLNPHHPGWYRFAAFYNCYRKGADADALEIGQRLALGMPTYYYSHLALAVAHAQLGHLEAARAALAEAVKLVPDFAAAVPREMEKWLHWNPELRARIAEGLGKAGAPLCP
jgi:non-specific serine/threonine protein kinase